MALKTRTIVYFPNKLERKN